MAPSLLTTVRPPSSARIRLRSGSAYRTRCGMPGTRNVPLVVGLRGPCCHERPIGHSSLRGQLTAWRRQSATRPAFLPTGMQLDAFFGGYDPSVSGERSWTAGADQIRADSTSRRWVEQLRPDHPRHEMAVAKLHDLLRRAALHELHRRR